MYFLGEMTTEALWQEYANAGRFYLRRMRTSAWFRWRHRPADVR